MAEQHQYLYDILEGIMSKEQMTFIRQHIDTLGLEKIKIKDGPESNYMDLMKFTVDMLVNYYRCTNTDAIMCTIFGLAPTYWVDNLPQNKADKINLTQLNQFRNLLLAGDISTLKNLQAISKEDNIYRWLQMAPNMSYSSSVALHVWMVTMAIKMTGIQPVNLEMTVSGGQILAMPETEAAVYLSYMMTLTQTMAKSNSWIFLKQFEVLKMLNIDLRYIVENFSARPEANIEKED